MPTHSLYYIQLGQSSFASQSNTICFSYFNQVLIILIFTHMKTNTLTYDEDIRFCVYVTHRTCSEGHSYLTYQPAVSFHYRSASHSEAEHRCLHMSLRSSKYSAEPACNTRIIYSRPYITLQTAKVFLNFI